MEARNLEGGHMTEDRHEQEKDPAPSGTNRGAGNSTTAGVEDLGGKFSLERWEGQVIDADLNATRKMILIVLGRISENGVAVATYSDVAMRAGVNEGSMYRPMKDLEEHGWITRTLLARDKGYRYTLLKGRVDDQ